MKPKAACFLLILMLGGLLFWSDAQDSTDLFYLMGERLDPPRLEMDVRFPIPTKVTEILAATDTQKLPVRYAPYGNKDLPDSTALLFLIDKSDPKRAHSVEACKALILRSLSNLANSTQVAVYAFDADLAPVAEFGTPRDEIAGRLRAIKVQGMATELYRNTIEAMKVLEKVQASRKALVLLSDGRAEDTTFTLDQTIARARNDAIGISAVGYAEKPSATVFLQSMRRMAAETGGQFAEADIRTKMEPADFLDQVMAKLKSGGHAVIDLTGLKGSRQINVEIRAEGRQPYRTTYGLSQFIPVEMAPVVDGNKKVDEVVSKVDDVAKKVADMAKNVAAVPAQVEEAAKKASEQTRQAEEEAAAARKQAEDAAAAKKDAEEKAAARRKRIIYSVLGVVLVGLLLAGASAFGLLGKLAPAPEGPVYARLQVLDGDGTEYAMRATALRVGRGKDNDLQLKNDSVSRHHAEIHRTRDGTFTITELNAGNGVLVNGAPVTKAALNHDDIIELGEVRIRFLIA